MTAKDFHVGWHITTSYQFLQDNWRHFLRLIIVPLTLWVLYKVMVNVGYEGQEMPVYMQYCRAVITASFALVWYRQFLLGSEHASYMKLLTQRFGQKSSLKDGLISFVRLIVITVVLVAVTMLISIAIIMLYHAKGWDYNDQILQDIALHTVIAIMLAFSPLVFRLSLLTAGTALGRNSIGYSEIWQRTKGYSLVIWLMMIRAFIPLVIFNRLLAWSLENLAISLNLGQVGTILLVSLPVGFLTFLMLAIVVGANAEAFRSLIGVRDEEEVNETGNRRRLDDISR